jgi:YbbR domain-containing protein
MHPARHWITDNWPLKVLSLGLSLLLWVMVASETMSEIGMEVPLEYRNVPGDMQISPDAANRVEVRLRGPANRLDKISPSELTTTVDLTNMPPGEQVISLSARNVRAPLGTEVVGIRPSHVRFSLVQQPADERRVRP